MASVRPGCFSQCRNTKGSTTRIAAGFFDRAVMTLSGRFCARAGSIDGRKPAARAETASLKTILTLGSWSDRDSGPIEAGGSGL